MGLITTSVHLIKLLDGIEIKGEPLLTGKAVDFVKYICTVFFMWKVMWWYDVTLLFFFFFHKQTQLFLELQHANSVFPFFSSLIWVVEYKGKGMCA